MSGLLKRFWDDESGQGLVEYALILFLIAIVAIVALRYLGKETRDIINNVADAINNPNGAP